MAHPSMRTAAQRGAEAEHVAVICGGGPNRPRIILNALAAWVAEAQRGTISDSEVEILPGLIARQ